MAQEIDKFEVCAPCMPTCPLPTLETQRRGVNNVGKCGEQWAAVLAEWKYYKKREYHWTANYTTADDLEGWTTRTYSVSDAAGGYACQSSEVDTGDDGPPYSCAVPWTYGNLTATKTCGTNPVITETVTLSDEFTTQDLDDRAELKLTLATWGAGSTASKNYTLNAGGEVETLTLSQLRYRVEIDKTFNPPPLPAPQKWHGSWHRVEVAEIFTPENGDPATETIKEIIWTGPGDLADDDSWRSDWLETDIPTDEGTITVELRRSQCYHGAPWADHS